MNENVDPKEIKKFAALADLWWDEDGELKTLHQLNPIRLSYIKEKTTLSNKKIVDIGCGGGILTEALSKEGANVTGIDMNLAVIKAAKTHQTKSGANVEYVYTSAEVFAKEHPEDYDIVTCLELLEHVPDPASIVKACSALVKPGGHVFFSTLNRNLKSYLFAIVGAEYIFKLLPQGTHDFAKFIKPSELDTWVRAASLATEEIKGIAYHPLTRQFSLSHDPSINYLLYAKQKRS